MKRFFALPLLLCALFGQAQQNTLLDQAFWKNKPDVAAVKAEVEKGNSPTEFNKSSFDPVVMAINAGAPNETIKYLLSFEGNGANKLTHDSRIYLHWAASRGNVEIMEFLLNKGANPRTEDSHGSTPLNFSVGGQKNTAVFDLLLAHGADLKKDLNHDGANALLLAIPQDKDFTLTDYFVSKGLSLNSTDKNGNTAFNYTARSGNIGQMNALLKKGVKFTDNALLMAAQGGRGSSNGLPVFEYLVGLGIKPAATNADGENVLHLLVRKPNQTDIINYFMGKGVDINQPDHEGNTAFMNAAASGSEETLNLLLPHVKNINQTSKKGVSALALAVRSNTTDVVKWLIEKGAAVQVKDAAGDNLAAYLIQSYNPMRGGLKALEEKARLLQEKGIDLAAPQQNGNTLYHLAIAKDDLELLKFVGQFNPDINGKNKESLTVLHKAAMTAKNDAILKYLLSAGAKKEITTELQETPFDLAQENEYLSKNKISVDFLK